MLPTPENGGWGAHDVRRIWGWAGRINRSLPLVLVVLEGLVGFVLHVVQ